MTAVAAFLRRNVEEIRADPVLRAYGAGLALAHVLTFLFWRGDAPLQAVLPVQATPICWPFFEDCHRFRFLAPAGIDALLWAYLALALGAMALFARRAAAAWAYASLMALEILKSLIIVQDYRLRMNQHYMAFFVALVFLAFPAKRRLLRYLVVLFYFWAGTLKLNRDWLSGAMFARSLLWVPASLVPLACAYVIALECVLVLGLLSRRRWIFWGTLGQLLLFHVISYPVVGFYYPSLMAALLSIFPLARVAGREGEGPSLAALGGALEPIPTYALLAGFSMLQLVPHLFPGDPAITGEGRLFALHMFDAQVICEAHVTVHDGQGGSRRVRIVPLAPSRVRCDPIVYLSFARALCRQGEEHRRWVDLDLSLRSRRTSESNLRPVVELDRFCPRNVHYDIWRSNPWILKQPPER
jgi:hypothetical protein